MNFKKAFWFIHTKVHGERTTSDKLIIVQKIEKNGKEKPE